MPKKCLSPFPGNRLNLFNRSVILILASLLQSCGGGGGSGGNGGGNPPPPPPGGLVRLTDANAATAGILSFGTAGDALQVAQILSDGAQMLHQQLLIPQDFPCSTAGSVRISASDNDLNGQLTVGDHVVVTFTDCNHETAGTIDLAITQIAFDSGTISTLDGRATIDLDFLDFPTVTLAGSGDLAFRASAVQLRWLGTNFSLAYTGSGQTERLLSGRVEKTLDASLNYVLTASGTIDSDGLDGRFNFTTNQAFTGHEGEWPTSGRLTATGDNSNVAYRPSAFPDLLAYEVNGGAATETPWLQIASGVLFGVFDDSDPGVPPPPSGDALGRRISLGAVAEDLQVDNARGKIYVTLPGRNELVVLSAQTLAVERRVIVGSRPSAMSSSLNGEELFIGLNSAGSIAIVDLDTFAVSQVFVAATLGSSSVYDVVETSPGILFISAARQRGAGIRLDRSTGIQTAIASFMNATLSIELLADPARGVLYIGDGSGVFPPNIYKLDTTNPLAPLILRSNHGSVSGTHRPSLNPPGTRIYLAGGQVLSTTDFSEIGRITAGLTWALDNGVDVVAVRTPGTVHIHSAQTLLEVDSLTSDCAMDFIDRIAPSPVDGQWLMLGNDILCVVDLVNNSVRPGTGSVGVPANPPPTLNVPVVDVALDAEAFDAEFDFSRNRLYVSIPTTGEVVTFDAANRQIIARDALGNAPRGLDLSPDENTLAVIFNGNGHIGFKNLASGQTETRDLTPFLISPQGHDVAYVNDDAIFASSSALGTVARVVKTSRLNPADTRVVASNRNIIDRPELAASPDGAFLYVSDRATQLYKLDLAQADAPLVLDAEPPGETFLTDRLSVSPDGARIADRGGQIMRTNDFTRAGEVNRGVPLYTRNGAQLYVASLTTPGRIDQFDSSSFVQTQQIHGNCSIADPRRLLANAAENVLMTVGQARLCFWYLNGQVTSSLKIGPHSAYVCDTDCLVRRYQQRSGSRLQQWKLQPPFTR